MFLFFFTGYFQIIPHHFVAYFTFRIVQLSNVIVISFSFMLGVEDLTQEVFRGTFIFCGIFIFQTHRRDAHSCCSLLRFQVVGAKATSQSPEPCDPGCCWPDLSARSTLSIKRQAESEIVSPKFIWFLKTSFHKPVTSITLLARDLAFFILSYTRPSGLWTADSEASPLPCLSPLLWFLLFQFLIWNPWSRTTLQLMSLKEKLFRSLFKMVRKMLFSTIAIGVK